VHKNKESALINKLNKQTTVQFNNYARLLGLTYARTTEAYNGEASPEVTSLFTSECLQYVHHV